MAVNGSIGSMPTPPASVTAHEKYFDFGVRTTSYPAVKNPRLPADGPGHDTFSTTRLISLILLAPAYVAWKTGGGFWTFFMSLAILAVPISVAFWYVASRISPPINESTRGPGRPIEDYLSFKMDHDRAKYWGRHKIPMATFTRKYFAGEVDFNGDTLEVLEYRHDWASWKFTWGMFCYVVFTLGPKFVAKGFSKEVQHAKHHDERGSDFYAWFLGPRMLYSTGIVSDMERDETLEDLQDNKLAALCEKIELQPGERLLDLGCGWGTLVTFASVNYGASVTGITNDENQASLGNWRLREAGISENQSQVENMSYQEITAAKYDKITCLQTAEQVGGCRMTDFFEHCYESLEDDGVFYVEVTGLRKPWQYEDLVWGLFLRKYIFPDAGALLPLASYVAALEAAGFEIQNIDTVGYHYSATLWRWYKNWIHNADKVKAKYGDKWYRIWEYFLATATIASRQGTTTCYQITLVKNLNSVHRADRYKSHFSVAGAVAASQAAGKARFPV